MLDTGLWRYTRHPNYFGDACVWWGLSLVAFSSWPGILTILSPLLMTWLLAKGTGKPLLEKDMASAAPATPTTSVARAGSSRCPRRSPRPPHPTEETPHEDHHRRLTGTRLRAARPGRQPHQAQRAAGRRPGRAVLLPGRAVSGGCSKEACHFRDLATEFKEAGAQRLGISTDAVAKQKEFADFNGFDYPLVSDESGEVATAFGVKRKYITPVKRATFVIDRDRTVRSVITSEMNMDVHADRALAALQGL